VEEWIKKHIDVLLEVAKQINNNGYSVQLRSGDRACDRSIKKFIKICQKRLKTKVN
jgi:hypothetical protein